MHRQKLKWGEIDKLLQKLEYGEIYNIHIVIMILL